MSEPAPPDPADLDTTRPHSGRVWNYLLGGSENYPADRAVGDAMVAQFPDIRVIARHARQFLARAVTHLAGEAGVDQFVDIGCGLPTGDDTHRIAQRADPAARVVYVDDDPLVRANADRLTAGSTPQGRAWYVHADVRDPAHILDEAHALLDFDRPVAVLLLGILGHAAPDFADMLAIVRTLVAGLPPGSYLVLQDGSDTSEDVHRGTTVNRYTVRTLDQFRECFAGLELVEPGLVPIPQWRPEPGGGEPVHVDSYGAVGRIPG